MSGEVVRVLVCGGRDYADRRAVFQELDALLEAAIPMPAYPWIRLTIIHGGQDGADFAAGEWARANDQPYGVIPAPWRSFGKRAGPLRNAAMLQTQRPDLVLAFPGGRGTADMVRKARAAGVEVREVQAYVR